MGTAEARRRSPPPVRKGLSMTIGVDAAWLPAEAWRAGGRRRVRVTGSGPLAETVVAELSQACARFGGEVVRQPGGPPCDLELGLGGGAALGAEGYELTGAGVRAAHPHGLLHGLFHLVRLG